MSGFSQTALTETKGVYHCSCQEAKQLAGPWSTFRSAGRARAVRSQVCRSVGDDLYHSPAHPCNAPAGSSVRRRVLSRSLGWQRRQPGADDGSQPPRQRGSRLGGRLGRSRLAARHPSQLLLAVPAQILGKHEGGYVHRILPVLVPGSERVCGIGMCPLGHAERCARFPVC